MSNILGRRMAVSAGALVLLTALGGAARSKGATLQGPKGTKVLLPIEERAEMQPSVTFAGGRAVVSAVYSDLSGAELITIDSKSDLNVYSSSDLHFGRAVALNGPEELAVLGAYGVSILRNSPMGWEIEGVVLGSFGSSMALQDNTLAVGDVDDGVGGVVAIYARTELSAPHWWFHSFVVGSDVDNGDGFGRNVAFHGDWLLVASPGTGQNGAAFVFRRDSSGNWLEHQKLVTAAPTANETFGRDIALSEDLLVIGGYGLTNGAFGSAYVYRLHPGTLQWEFEARLEPRPGEKDARFGSSLCITRLGIFVGSPGSPVRHAEEAGKVYQFVETGHASKPWEIARVLHAEKFAKARWFGRCLAFADDTLVVGSAWLPLDTTDYLYGGSLHFLEF